MNVTTNLSRAGLVERGQANVAWIKAHLPALAAAAAAAKATTFADKLSKAVQTVFARHPRYGLARAAQKKKDDEEFERLKEKARRIGQNVDWQEQERFKRKPRAGVVATGFQADEDFGKKFSEAIKRRIAWRTESERAYRERAANRRKHHRPPPPPRRK